MNTIIIWALLLVSVVVQSVFFLVPSRWSRIGIYCCASIGGIMCLLLIATTDDVVQFVIALGSVLCLWWFGSPLYRSMPSFLPALPSPGFNRRVALQKNGGRHTETEWNALKRIQHGRCLSCGQRRPLTKDHIVPVYHGGSDDISNIQGLCQPCNSAKGTRTIDYRKARS
jgi:predicted membrane channel-forming protein YqfA (hemolysin III family)